MKQHTHTTDITVMVKVNMTLEFNKHAETGTGSRVEIFILNIVKIKRYEAQYACTKGNSKLFIAFNSSSYSVSTYTFTIVRWIYEGPKYSIEGIVLKESHKYAQILINGFGSSAVID